MKIDSIKLLWTTIKNFFKSGYKKFKCDCDCKEMCLCESASVRASIEYTTTPENNESSSESSSCSEN